MRVPSPSHEFGPSNYIHCTAPHTILFGDLYQEQPGLRHGSETFMTDPIHHIMLLGVRGIKGGIVT